MSTCVNVAIKTLDGHRNSPPNELAWQSHSGCLRRWIRRTVATLCSALLVSLGATALAETRIGVESRVPSDPRQEHARFVRFRPADGQVVTLNPPRFSWPYVPEILPRGSSVPADQAFTLQISSTNDFSHPQVEVRETDCNFYSFLPELKGSPVWFWRVQYGTATGKRTWSQVRRFTIAPEAVVWDRSKTLDVLDQLKGHPRILFHAGNRDTVMNAAGRDPYSQQLATYIIDQADAVIRSKSYRDFPQDDSRDIGYGGGGIGSGLMYVAYAYVLTGDKKYAGCKERFLTMASWPKGGWSSPEGVRTDSAKWETHLTGYLGLFYDWFYHELTAAERAVVRGSIEWRIDHTLNSFAWRRKGGSEVRPGCISMMCSSHPYEATMVSMAGPLAICDESPIGRKALEIGIQYLQSLTNGMGEDEAWNEGPGYGNGKMKWLTDATWYLHTAMPQLELNKNEAYDNLADFFARLTPLGARHSSFGNRGINESDWTASRAQNMYRIAMLTGNPTAMQNWVDTRRRYQDLRQRAAMPTSPWVDHVLRAYASAPTPQSERDTNKLFPLEGWVTVSSASPSDYYGQREAVSMTFACRPRGGYSHAFRSENAFDIHAFGKTIAVGGGSTSNQSRFANHSMSHNTVLVNGLEQVAAGSRSVPSCGRIIAYHEDDACVYWAGDARGAYGSQTGLERFVRHVLFVDNAYFVIYDQLGMRQNARPARFQWLYHVTPAVGMEIDQQAGFLRYAVDDVDVLVQHTANVADLEIQDRPGAEGMLNPVTGEDLRGAGKWLTRSDGTPKPGKTAPKPLDAHHVWISNKTPRRQMQFLAVIVPYRHGQQPPTITPVDDATVQVSFGESEKRISFRPDRAADISVDVDKIVESP